MANRPNRYISLSKEEDERLRELEQNAYIHKKARLRAQILRLSHRGLSVREIAKHVGKGYNMVRESFSRWEREGVRWFSRSLRASRSESSHYRRDQELHGSETG